jgi:Putative transposase
VVAFSCKKRRFCPSYCAKRMAEAATRLTENVLPLVPYRQFVVSFPIALCYSLHTNKRFAAEVFGLVSREIHRYCIAKATAAGITEVTPGSVAFTQRWGSALNLNPHLHIISIDGVYTRCGDVARFLNLDPLPDDESMMMRSLVLQKALLHGSPVCASNVAT